ncbi:hypothetical protein [Paenibacillus sp.]|nr:hypothetical protein [Paenibacillus sp.]HZG57862.1 hypothetical protein [Paenibacillus sp.]
MFFRRKTNSDCCNVEIVEVEDAAPCCEEQAVQEEKAEACCAACRC